MYGLTTLQANTGFVLSDFILAIIIPSKRVQEGYDTLHFLSTNQATAAYATFMSFMRLQWGATHGEEVSRGVGLGRGWRRNSRGLEWGEGEEWAVGAWALSGF